MKKKISKILGVGLALVLAFSLVGAFLPADDVEAQAYTPNMWNVMSIPTAAGGVLRAGGSVSDFAMGSDGATIYAMDAAGDTIQIVITAASGGLTPANDVAVVVGFTDQTGAAGAGAVVIPGNSVVGGVPTPVALVLPATGVIDVTLATCAGVTGGLAMAFNIVGVNRGTVYASGVDSGVAVAFTDGAEYQGVLKSTNGGLSFSALVSPTAAAGFVGPARLVAASPDDPNVMAIVDSAAADRVWLSTSGGAIWSDMGIPGVLPAENITDIAISPARATAVLGRDVAVATADPGGGVFGNLYLVGQTLTWTPVGFGGAVKVFDYSSVACEPNWVGGRGVVAIAHDAATTRLQVQRTSTPVTNVANTTLAVTGVVFPTDLGSGTTFITSTLALPSDFDSTSIVTVQAYLGFNAPAAANSSDVFRVDSLFTWKLNVPVFTAIESIDFSGTRAGGTLFAGESGMAMVWSSANPQTALPTWSFTYKAPTGAANTTVAMAPDFDSSNIVYAGTTGAECGFSRSSNGGLSFNQISLVNTAIAALDDVMPAPGGSTLFLATNSGANASLWRSEVTPPSIGTWQRVRLRAAPAVAPWTYIIRLSPEYADDSAVYYCQRGGFDIQRSTNGGDIFAPRQAAAAITDIVVENATTLYMASGANVFKSTNGAWFFGLGIDGKVGTIHSLAMAPTYPDKPIAGNVLVGGRAGGYVSLSTNGGDSFAPLLAAIPGGINMQVVADKNYADNDLVYAGSALAGQGIYRYEVGVSKAWESIRPIASPVTGLAMHCGALYGAWTTGAASSVHRSLYAYLPVIAGGTFDVMTVGAATAVFNSAPSALRVTGDDTEVWLWAIDTAAGALMAYNDTMAKVAPVLTAPAEVPADPATGGNAAFMVTWTLISNATTFNVEIYTDASCTERVAWSLPVAAYTPAMPLAPSWAVARNLVPSGATYYIRVQVRNQAAGDGIRSQWSNVESFTVASGVPITAPHGGPQLLGPAGGASDVSLRPGFAWAPVLGATEYEFVLSTNADLTTEVGPVKVTQPSYQLTADLSYSTTYFWGVKVTKPATGPQSIGTFTTMAKPEAPIVVQEAPPAPIVEIPAPIPNWMLVTIIVIGAVLGIAVIVLIIRTRRVV